MSRKPQAHDLALVVPVLDDARWVPSLASALAALRPGSEAVVVDGGSRDGTVEALHAHAAEGGYRVLELAEVEGVAGAGGGRAAQLNAGVRATSAPVLLFSWADTRLPADAVASVRAAVARGATCGCFRLRIATRDPRLKAACGLVNLHSRLLPSATSGQAVFVRRDVFEAIGGFRPVPGHELLDLLRRMARLGRFHLLDNTVEISPRRWQGPHLGRAIAIRAALRVGYHLGVDPALLDRWHPARR